MPRVIWKGAISFGLVHIPVVLHAASTETGVHFDLVDRRTADPIGYRRFNKVTGETVENDQIVRAYEYEKGRYVMLGDDEIKAASVASTQTVEIEGFIDRDELPFLFLEKPYYLAPDKRGAKVYALLRDALERAGKIGIATVVMHTKQHLAALIPEGPVLVLNTLRWADEVNDPEPIVAEKETAGRSGAGLTKSAAPSEAELAMARKLIDDMSSPWEPERYHDTFRDDILELVERKVAAGKTHVIEHPDTSSAHEGPTGDVLDLTELLKRSLQHRTGPSKNDGEKTERAAPAAPRRSSSTKSGARDERHAKEAPEKRPPKGAPRSVKPNGTSTKTRSSARRTRASA